MREALWYQTAALALSAGGVLAVVAAVALRRELRAGSAMMLELWTAAGLLRLASDPGVPEIAGVAAIIGIRGLLRIALK